MVNPPILQSSKTPKIHRAVSTFSTTKVHVQRQGLRDHARRGVVHLRQKEELTLAPWCCEVLEDENHGFCVIVGRIFHLSVDVGMFLLEDFDM